MTLLCLDRFLVVVLSSPFLLLLRKRSDLGQVILLEGLEQSFGFAKSVLRAASVGCASMQVCVAACGRKAREHVE